MTTPSGRRPQPQILTATGIVVVPAEDTAQMAGWLMLLRDLLAGRIPPGGARQPHASKALHAYIDVMNEAAREHEDAQIRAASLGSAKIFVVGPAQIAGSWISQEETITTAEAGALLGVTDERARQLAASDEPEIRGYKKDGKWRLYRADVIAYRDRRRGADDRDQARAGGHRHAPAASGSRGRAASHESR